jgi:hypothetical protein
MTFSDRPQATTVERAYQLAQSGECAGVDEIRRRLSREGYADAPQQLSAPTLRRSLTKLCLTAQNKTRPPPPGRTKSRQPLP